MVTGSVSRTDPQESFYHDASGSAQYILLVGVGLSNGLLQSTSGYVSRGLIAPHPSLNWASRRSVSKEAVAFRAPVAEVERASTASPPPVTSAELVARVRDDSGLTWDQLARYFGVSRRAVHLWAAGGRMSASNEELLMHLVDIVETLADRSPEARRQTLLSQASGLNIVDTERARRSSNRSDINRSPEIGVLPDNV